MNLLFHGDALHLAAHVAHGSVTLAYLDPPFNVGTTFGARTKKGEARATGPKAYEDRWASVEAFVDWLAERLTVVRSLLSDEGTLFLHLDHRAVHEAKVRCDALFGKRQFHGEIIWLPGNGAKGRKGLGVTHQTLLVYAKAAAPVWNARDPMLREPFAATSLSMHFTNEDADGRRYRERTIASRTYRYYADEGRALGSVWSDCPAMVANTPLQKEATGYPTQKPLKLLERVVRAASRVGDVVLDPFCGSGTTLIAAARHGRGFVGSDRSPLAISTTRARLEAAGAPFAFRKLGAQRS